MSPIRCVPILLHLLLGCTLASPAQSAPEAAYPARTVRIVVPTAVGGAGDTLARYLGDRLGASLRVPVVVENRPGAGGLIGSEMVALAGKGGGSLEYKWMSPTTNQVATKVSFLKTAGSQTCGVGAYK